LRVVKHEADEEKDVFRVILKGNAADLVNNCLIEAELRLKGKVEDLLEKFPRCCQFAVQVNAQLERK